MKSVAGRIVAFVVTALCALAVPLASAQSTYPTKPVRLVVPGW